MVQGLKESFIVVSFKEGQYTKVSWMFSTIIAGIPQSTAKFKLTIS